MNKNLDFKMVNKNNVKFAIEIQQEIFPDENGTINLLSSIDRSIFKANSEIIYPSNSIKYYLVYYEEEVIGITGIYSYPKSFPNDAWVGWFGIKKEYRNCGFGRATLDWTINKAKEEGYKTIRLYTDSEANKKAVELYKQMGFIGEKYLIEQLPYDCYIYSKSLTDKPVKMWNNKLLDLKGQQKLNYFDCIKASELFDKIESIE